MIVVYRQFSNVLPISWRGQVHFLVHFVLDQHAEWNCFSASSNSETNLQIEQIVLLISLSIVLTLYIILELPLFDCIIFINSVVVVALYEERIYIGLSCYPILFNTFLNKIRLNYSASSLKQQSAGRHVAPLGHIILIPSQPVFPVSP